MSDELYRKIEDDEFRGDEYFEADWESNKTEWIETTPPKWKFAVYPGDRFILKDLGTGEYVIVGGKVGDVWAVPHLRTDIEYRVHSSQLKNIIPRKNKNERD